MNTGGETSGDVFDPDRLRRLIELMEAHDLSEIDLQQGDEKVKLRRGGEAVMSVPARTAAPAPMVSAPAAPSAPAATDGPHIVTIKAPMVGTFYSRPNPQSEPFVKVGQRVSADTVVCIIEAMKVFNEIPAEVSGQVVAVLIDTEQPVDFGRALFKVDTSA
ncbi:MAG: acetyl-CoA carboxylase biotin carboxyl carrier protein [Planctomycetaceae bacterium]